MGQEARRGKSGVSCVPETQDSTRRNRFLECMTSQGLLRAVTCHASSQGAVASFPKFIRSQSLLSRDSQNSCSKGLVFFSVVGIEIFCRPSGRMESLQRTATLKGVYVVDRGCRNVTSERARTWGKTSLPRKFWEPGETLTHMWGLDWSAGPLGGAFLAQALPLLPHFQDLHICGC